MKSCAPWISALLLLFCSGPRALGADKPNILFLFADDQRADTIAALGNPHIRTPNIDKLVHAGFTFRSNYCFGGNSGAVCVPSRAMLMSGKTWFHVDTTSLTGVKLLPELLQENGYVTFATGKWHNGQPSWLRAFQRGKAVMFGGMSDHSRVPVRDLGPDGKLTAERTGEKFSSELFADAAIEFLRNHDRKKPFFAYVAFTAPHDPRMPPLAFREMYYRNLPPLPANFLPQLPFDNGMMKGGRDENLAPWPRTEAVVRDQLAEYYGMITHLDEQIGRILAALKETGQADNTLIVYAADNGLALGSHGLLGKQSVFEHSMRVPLIFVGPGIPSGKSTQAFSYLLDVFPTLCDAVGIQPPADLEGASLRALWEGKKERVRDSVFLPYINIQRAVRDERWKLVCYPKIGHMQLFDLQADSDEKINLIDRAESASHVQRLLKLMSEWQAKVGDTLPLPTANRPPEPVDLTGRKRVPDPWQPDWIVRKYFDASPAAPQANQARPNIVYLLVDDLGSADVGFMGSKDVRTPAIDRLAREGAILRSFYVQPVCSPTRAALLTGRYATHTGVYTVVRPGAPWGLPLAERTLPQALREAGYTTAICGKWHLGEFQRDYMPTRRGFDHQYGHMFGALDYFTHIRDSKPDWYRDDQPLQEEGYTTHLIAKEACRLIRAQPADKPLFLYVAFNGVHAPYQVPPEYQQAFPNLRGNRQTMAAMLAAVDEAIGQITAALDEKGLRRNTLIIFSSDNGGPAPGRVSRNTPLRAGKGTIYEGGVRACAFATWPGHIPAGTTINEPMHVVDWYPTLLRLAGASLEQKLAPDGLDVWPMLTQGAKSPHDAILLVGSAPSRAALRMGDWKLLLNADAQTVDATPARDDRAADQVELYHLAEDIRESRDLAAAQPEKVTQMRTRLEALLKDAVPPRENAATK